MSVTESLRFRIERCHNGTEQMCIDLALLEKYPNTELFLVGIFRFLTEYGALRNKSSYSI